MKNIKSKILFAMLSLMLIILASLMAVFQWYVKQTNVETLNQSLQTLSAQAASNFDYIIKDCISDFQSYAKSSEYSTLADNKKRLEMLTDEFSDHNEINSFAIYDKYGNIQESSDNICNTLVTGDNITMCSQRKDTLVSEVCELENVNYFVILVPLISDDQITLLTAAAVDCSVVNKTLANLTRNDSTELFVADKTGRIIFSSGNGHTTVNSNPVDLSKSDTRAKGLADAIQTAISGRSGFYSYEYNDEKYTMGYMDTSYFDSVLIATANNAVFNGASTTKEFALLGITFVVLLILTLLYANVFSSRISKPIVSTTERLRLLANGDTSSSVDLWNSKDELGVLSNSLGETVSCLRLYIMLIRQALKNIADGNLTYRMEADFKGDFISIKESFNDIFDQLCNTFDSINHSAQQVTSGAVQVANSAHSLSQGATQQASAIEELSATLTNVSDQVVQNSESARNAYKIVDDNSHAIEDCNADMDKLLEAMQLISRTAEEITQILKAIDEISFQTNILALNAAVEAAREGSKGFGVVADEVRRLAARTAEAARQTSSLIDKTSEAVTRGHSIAVKTADSLREVEEGSAQICLLMRNIAEASAEQSDAIMQINTGVDQISDVVSANTAAAIGSASASEELSGQSLILKNMIARFRLTNAPTEHEPKEEDPDTDYNFSIAAANPSGSVQKYIPPKADTSGASPKKSLTQLRAEELLNAADDDDDDDSPAPSAKKNRGGMGGMGSMGSIFMKRDKSSDDDEDDDDESAPAKDTNKESLSKANDMLAALMSRSLDDDDDDDDTPPAKKSGIEALFRTDVDDEDDKY